MWAEEENVAPAEMIGRLQEFSNSLWFDGWERVVIEGVINGFFLEDRDYLPHIAASDSVWHDPPSNTVSVPCRENVGCFCNPNNCLISLGFNLDGSRGNQIR
jgi:hypothetical protein